MMTLISTLLTTAWMSCVVLGFTLGGVVHVLAVAAVMVIFLGGNRAPRMTSR
jgi:hypothetical protein